MLTKNDLLLTCLMEECGEVTKAAAKIVRFGHNDIYPEIGRPNSELLAEEIGDLYGIISMLIADGTVKERFILDKLSKKQAKFEKFYEFSKQQGRVQ